MTDSGARILVVDDEPAVRRFLRVSLASQGYAIFEASTGEEALKAVVAHRPDLIILDLGLPDLQGVEVTRRLREWSQTPIIILSVRGQEGEKIAAFEAGADDYLTKPFGLGELTARMRAALRHSAPVATEPVYASGDLQVDLGRRVVSLSGREIQLTPTEYDLLKMLVRNADKVVTHRQLLQEIWGSGYGDDAHLLRVNVSNLRRKIEADPSRPRLVVTEPGVGYRLRTLT
jgi:two-component system KDP operon response regulator KdpE